MRWLLALALLSFLLPTAVVAQDAKMSDVMGWEISLFAGAHDDDPEFDPDGSRYFIEPDKNLLFGASVGYHLDMGVFFEVQGSYFPWDMNPVGQGLTDLNSYYINGSVGYSIPLLDRLSIYGIAGAGISVWEPDGFKDMEEDLTFNWGGGARVFLTPSIALRGEARMHYTPDALNNTSVKVANVQPDDEFLAAWAFTGGVSYFFGGHRDADKDGVWDENDSCPDTPEGVAVDLQGCPLDGDGDGVADYMDQCSGTPSGARVDANGCPTDADGDGVFDGLDRCPNTPAGATVDANGCPSDSDGDGVWDGIDQCANTPSGARVDATGCPMDGDGDGVPDGIDRCPNTAPNSEVDEFGCPVSEIQRALEVEGRFTFSAVNFDFDSARLRDEAMPILEEVGRVLVGQRGEHVTVQGYTDSSGSESYNQGLSERRAQAVVDYLVENYSELSEGRFTVQGFGEADPVATNDTRDGRAQNRRVEILLGSGR
jgi:outer membrane protein OmpA-like peptidoglycan-associated protein/opacity protein-like surface antigen